MRLPLAPATYSQATEQQFRLALETALISNLTTEADIIIPNAIRLVLTSPDGTLYRLNAANGGTLSLVAYP
jgi:hypothetical protein